MPDRAEQEQGEFVEGGDAHAEPPRTGRRPRGYVAEGDCEGCGGEMGCEVCSPSAKPRATVPASEYDALAEAFCDVLAEHSMVRPEQVGHAQVVDALAPDYDDDALTFLAKVAQEGSRVLSSRIPGTTDCGTGEKPDEPKQTCVGAEQHKDSAENLGQVAEESSAADVGLNLGELREQNVARAERWHGPDSESWSLADWSNAMCGEAGETANVVKKIRRHETSADTSYNTPALETLQRELAAEIADTLIYVDLLAHFAGIDLSKAVRQKFNEVSFKQNFPEQLAWPASTTPKEKTTDQPQEER